MIFVLHFTGCLLLFVLSSSFVCLNISSSQLILTLVHIFSTLQSPPPCPAILLPCALWDSHVHLWPQPYPSLLDQGDHITSWEPLFSSCTWFHVLIFFHKLLSHSPLDDMKKVTFVCSEEEQWTWDAQSWGSQPQFFLALELPQWASETLGIFQRKNSMLVTLIFLKSENIRAVRYNLFHPSCWWGYWGSERCLKLNPLPRVSIFGNEHHRILKWQDHFSCERVGTHWLIYL